jgi:hypothetical protein
MAPDTLSSADFLDQTLARWSLRATRVAQRFPRSLTAAVVVAMAGFGATAFGVAPLDIDTVTRPQAWITESVAPDDLGAQIQSLATFDLPLFRNAITRASDTADSLLQRLNVNDAQAARWCKLAPMARANSKNWWLAIRRAERNKPARISRGC